VNANKGDEIEKTAYGFFVNLSGCHVNENLWAVEEQRLPQQSQHSCENAARKEYRKLYAQPIRLISLDAT
jgi:hypothetical protein